MFYFLSLFIILFHAISLLAPSCYLFLNVSHSDLVDFFLIVSFNLFIYPACFLNNLAVMSKDLIKFSYSFLGKTAL